MIFFLFLRGSLLTRSLAEIVKKDDFVLDSEYLVTLLVVAPRPLQGPQPHPQLAGPCVCPQPWTVLVSLQTVELDQHSHPPCQSTGPRNSGLLKGDPNPPPKTQELRNAAVFRDGL